MTRALDREAPADFPRDLSKASPRASLGIANARADLDAVYRALLYTKPSTPAELQRLLDAPGLRPGITENRVQASLFLLREHGLATNPDEATRPILLRAQPYVSEWLRTDPS